MPATLIIPARFNGPPSSAHGGYVCGRLAALAASRLAGPVRVTLHLPVPLQVPLTYEVSGPRGYLFLAGQLAATVSAAQRAIPDPEAVPVADAVTVQGRPGDHPGHPFPSCFVCGTERPGDGLGLRPGAVPGPPGRTACVWRPGPSVCGDDGLVRPEIVWSALDCPGGWTCDLVREPRVLASMTATIQTRPRAGGRYVLAGTLLGVRSRTATVVTGLFGEQGQVLARALASWVTVSL